MSSIPDARRFLRIVWEFAKKDFRVLTSYRVSFAVGIVGTVYGIVSFRFVSHLIGGTKYFHTASEYFRFVVVGVVVAGVMRASMITTAQNARRDQVEGTLEILATQPMSLMTLGFGWAILPVLEELIAGLITIAVAIPLGFTNISPNWPVTVLILVISAVMFVSVGFIAAATVLAIQQGAAFAGIAGAGMTLLSGTLFPVNVLPSWLRPLSDVSPLTYALRATRTAIDNSGDTARLFGQTGILLAITVVLLPAGLLVLRMAFNYARARGSLARF